MRVLITGAGGQLGQDVMRVCAEAGHEGIGVDRAELDITDEASCIEVLERLRPEAVIHAAAYTAVDRAETDVDEAYRVNAAGSRNMAVACERIGARCCYISTDYVFDGSAAEPYGEYDLAAPRSVYGKSKLAGERLVSSLCSRWFIVRTSWVYGVHGDNFVKTMLKLAATGKPLKVVDDQTGSPTYTVDLSRFLVRLIETERYGIYHATGGGSCTWYEFARAIFEERGLQVELAPCSTGEFPRPAPRPAYSVLGAAAIRTNGFQELPHWREGLRAFLKELPKDGTAQ
ncbi:dTDP-4-dehydrorhamnose reductase [Gorillibacterium sp. sgz5001074]|uniref:dTDP-4-dehydrorhamnose reductase n=1 Tax=Gorillibacterium sp. sgz5001074 TaxID=3446695 RepID=UPI003F675D22